MRSYGAEGALQGATVTELLEAGILAHCVSPVSSLLTWVAAEVSLAGIDVEIQDVENRGHSPNRKGCVTRSPSPHGCMDLKVV